MPNQTPRSPLAYKDPNFLDSYAGRSVRLLSEYLEPLNRFRANSIKDTVVFFGSARTTEDSPLARYYNEARETARLVTEWSESLPANAWRFVVCTGGGPGIMEAANRGALDASGKSIGLNIGLPSEQFPNPYITPGLSFEFHYFFMRKFWFAYLAKALVVFPGGFGTMDELFELLTLVQTRKLRKKMIVVLYGSEFWKEVINFDALVKHGVISPEDLNLFQWADDPQTAFQVLRDSLTKNYLEPKEPPSKQELQVPAIAETRIK